jgi:hypothetical protein
VTNGPAWTSSALLAWYLPLGHAQRPGACKKGTLPNGIGKLKKSAAVTMNPSTRSGTMLKNGLQLHAPVTRRPTCRQHGRP